MKIIPAIDIIDGKCVRLTQGDFSRQTNYHDNPVDVAKHFENAGLQRVHIVDLDGAKRSAIKNLDVLIKIASATSLEIRFGGGISKEQDITDVLNSGASLVTIGSLALKQPLLLEEWIKKYGTDKFFIGADSANNKVMIHGWQLEGGTDIFAFLEKMLAIGATNFFCTDIKKDGAMNGPSLELYEEIMEKFPGIQLTASGGITTLQDLEELKAAGCEGAIIGKAIYEHKISLEQLALFQ